MSKLNLQPIIRNVSTDKYDAGNWKHREEYPVYYAFLYDGNEPIVKGTKPVYKLTCMYKNMLQEAIENFLKGELNLRVVIPIMMMKFNKPWDYESVMVDVLTEE